MRKYLYSSASTRRVLAIVLTSLAIWAGICTVLADFPHAGRVSASPGPLTSTTITLSPSAATIQGCETIQVEIRINDVADLYAADVRLSFDPTVLEVVDFDLGKGGIQLEDGGFLKPDWYGYDDQADNLAGTIQYAVTQFNPALPKSGSGVLAIIHFKAKTAGTSSLHFTYTKLADRDGTTLSATHVDGSVSTTAPTSSTASITRLDSTTARLSWTASLGVAEYNLYRDTTPYFSPADPPYQTTTNLSYDDAGVLGNTNTNYYYVVKSACENGFKSTASNRIGEYDYPLTASSTANYNDIALALDVTSVNDAETLASYIGNSVQRVIRYNAATQSYQTYLVGNHSTNFALSIGQFVFVVTDNTAPASIALAGNVPDAGSVSFALTSGSPAKYNFLSLPLDQADLTTASAVASDVGSGVARVVRYRIDTQTYQTYVPGNSSTDFSLVIGAPFVLVLTSGAPSNWP